MNKKLSAREAAILSQIDGLILAREPISINFKGLSKTIKGREIAAMIRKKLNFAGYKCINPEAEIETYKPEFLPSDFGPSFSKMFLDRISDIDTFKPLQALKAYQDAKTAYSSLYNSIFDTEVVPDKKTVLELIRAIHRIQDMEMEYIYRLGIQEGVSMRAADFLISGIE